MTTPAGEMAGWSGWTRSRLRVLLIAVTLLVITLPVVLWAIGSPDRAGWIVALGAVLAVLQVRHGLAAADGRRPRAAGWSLFAVAVLVYLPVPWVGTGWLDAGFLLTASALLVLRGRMAVVVAAAPVLVSTAHLLARSGGEPLPLVVHELFYLVFSQAAFGASLYGSARLVRTFEELRATRAELAELAVARERLQISRNLHDLLGQSLSAVSLKGDLALRLLTRRPAAAEAEIRSLVGVTRDALHGVRAVTRGEFEVSLRTELDGAAALLRAAGVDARLEIDLPELPEPQQQALAWVVREAVTNVLRHSTATVCRLTAGQHGGRTSLEIVNDGARDPVEPGRGSGLDGIADRVRAVGGTVAAGPTGAGGFRVVVELPVPVADEA